MSMDTLIDTLVSDAQIANGESLPWLGARGNIARPAAQKSKAPPPRWTKDEEQFYLDHLAIMTMEQIGVALGRTTNAVKIHAVRKGLLSHRKVPGYLTTHQVAVLLGVDSHTPPGWVDHGIMPGERIPYTNSVTRRVSIIQFKLWLVRPTSWIYFDAKRIRNASLRRLVQLAQARWGDEWWTTRQAGDYLGCNPTDVHRQIKLGHCPAVRARLLSGRNVDQVWAYWYLRRSDAVKLVIYKNGKGTPGTDRTDAGWSPRADAFLLRARAEGKSYSAIGRMMKWNVGRVWYRYNLLKSMKLC